MAATSVARVQRLAKRRHIAKGDFETRIEGLRAREVGVMARRCRCSHNGVALQEASERERERERRRRKTRRARALGRSFEHKIQRDGGPRRRAAQLDGSARL